MGNFFSDAQRVHRNLPSKSEYEIIQLFVIVIENNSRQLQIKDFRALTAVCTTLHKCSIFVKESSYFFNIPNGEKLTIFKPKKVIVDSTSSIPTSANWLKYRPRISPESLKSIPPSITHLSLGDEPDRFCRQPLDLLPATVTHLYFVLKEEKYHSISTLPSSLVHLSIGSSVVGKICNLPPSITYLSLGYCTTDITSFPPSITQLVFGWCFNCPVDNILPPYLTHLTFSHMFNCHVNKLPQSLKFLKLGALFNLPVDSLPSSLTHLIFGHNFDLPVNFLPPSLTHLTFGWKFNQIIDALPPSLTYLFFGEYFNQLVDNLPRSLRQISFGFDFSAPLTNLPPNLFILTFANDEYDLSQCVLPRSISFTKLGRLDVTKEIIKKK